MIDKDTEIYCSFSGKAGNLGCKLFNTAFQIYKLNAIYKSFSVTDIKKAVDSVNTLGIAGFAVSMPFKQEILKYVDEVSDDVENIGSANTILNRDGKLIGYNTDWLAAKDIIASHNPGEVFILGNGGYAKAVSYACKILKKKHTVINRENWEYKSRIRDSFVYNCTPLENSDIDKSNIYIDSLTTTETGMRLSIIQASHQFKLYTGLELPELDWHVILK